MWLVPCESVWPALTPCETPVEVLCDSPQVSAPPTETACEVVCDCESVWLTPQPSLTPSAWLCACDWAALCPPPRPCDSAAMIGMPRLIPTLRLPRWRLAATEACSATRVRAVVSRSCAMRSAVT